MIAVRDAYQAQTLLKLWQNEFPDLPFEAVVKQDILRQGLTFTAAALAASDYKKKDYFIFTFDRAPLKDIPEHTRVPEEIRIFTDPSTSSGQAPSTGSGQAPATGSGQVASTPGVAPIQPTVISVRLNPDSPYKLDADETGRVRLYLGDEALANALYPPVPAYYGEKFSFDKPIGEVAPAIEWGYLIYLTVFRNCQYFGKDEECQFCDINHNWRQQKREGRPYTGVKDPAHIVEALERIAATDQVARAFTITGGSVTGKLSGKDEIEFYLQYPRAMSDALKERFISKMVIQAWETDDCKKAVEAGVKIYHPNYEVWDAELFKKICPGKERFIGRDNWINRVVASAEAFGAMNVIPNFVGGVEMADGGRLCGLDATGGAALHRVRVDGVGGASVVAGAGVVPGKQPFQAARRRSRRENWCSRRPSTPRRLRLRAREPAPRHSRRHRRR